MEHFLQEKIYFSGSGRVHFQRGKVVIIPARALSLVTSSIALEAHAPYLVHPLRIPIAPRLDQAGALSHRILSVQVRTLSSGLAWCVPCSSGGFKSAITRWAGGHALLVGRRRRQRVLYETRRWSLFLIHSVLWKPAT